MAATSDNGSEVFGRVARLLITRPSGSFSDTDPQANTLVIGGGDTADDIGLRLVGKLEKTGQKAPNKGEISVYNLAPTTRAQLQQKGLRAIIEAGHISQGVSRIYVGDVRSIDHVRDGASIRSTLKLGDGERAARYSRASESFGAGTKVGDVVRYCANAMGLALGNVAAQADQLGTTLYHGWTAHGSAQGELDRVLRAVGFSYSIQDGAIQILAPGQSLAQSIPLLSPETGLLGSPEMGSSEKTGKPQTLKVRSLLLPSARPGGRVHVQSERYNAIFRIRKVNHSFDTMSGDWYSDLETIADNTVKIA